MPPAVQSLKDGEQIAVSSDSAAVLRKDGTILWWNEKGLLDPPAGAKNLFRIAGGGKGFIGLKGDGTVIAWSSESNSTVRGALPPNLTDVVDVYAKPGTYLALRADGKWVGWGSRQEELDELLQKMDGVRWLDVGGTTGERAIVGIRPDPQDLKR